MTNILNLLSSIPKGFMLFGHEVRFYGIISALSYILGIVICCKLAKKRGFKTEDIITLACYVVPCAIIGARLYFVLFNLEEFTNFVDIFKIWQGGLAFYGGMIGGGLAVLLYCLIHKKNFFALLDIIAPSMALAQALGRWGNFFNQEAYGYAIKSEAGHWFPFGVKIDYCYQYYQGLCMCGGSGWHLATFFYESVWNVISFAIMLMILYKVDLKQNGVIASCYLILYGLGRSIIEGLRTDSLYLGSIRISQLLSIIFIVVGVAGLVLCLIMHFKKKSAEDASFKRIMKVLKKEL